MEHETPLRVVYASRAAHLGGWIGLAFVGALSLVGFAFNVWLGLFLVASVALGVIMIETVRRADRLALYEHGVAREYRLLSTHRTYAEYESIQDTSVMQTVVDRVLGIGTLHINTAGGHGQEITFRGIKDCHEFEAAIRARMSPRHVDTPAA
jgi:uncharacterized membrane protein YdbT with pleckstrin-like domain